MFVSVVPAVQCYVQDSVRMLQEAGVRCLALLALLLPRDVARLFPRMRPQQRRLLAICCARLDPRPPYQVTAAIKRFLARPLHAATHSSAAAEDGGSKPAEDGAKAPEGDKSDVEAALKLVDNSKKILECPVCYLTCLPPRIWQVRPNNDTRLNGLGAPKYFCRVQIFFYQKIKYFCTVQ